RADDALLAGRLHRLDLLQEMTVDERSFLDRTRHDVSPTCFVASRCSDRCVDCVGCDTPWSANPRGSADDCPWRAPRRRRADDRPGSWRYRAPWGDGRANA